MRKIKGIFGKVSVGEQGFADGLLDDLREMALFEFVDVGGDVVGGVGGGDGGAELRDDGAAVVVGGDPVDGDASFCFASLPNGLVNVVAVHSLAAELGQQGGMEVEYPMGIGVDEVRRNYEQESSQNDEIDIVFFEQIEHFFLVLEVGFRNDGRRDVQSLGSHECKGIGAVADNERNADFIVVGEIADDVFAVGAAAGNENGEIFHFLWSVECEGWRVKGGV